MKNFIKKYKELFIVILTILIAIAIQLGLTFRNNYKEKNKNNITIDEIKNYGTEIVNKKMLPNIVVAKANGENIYKYDVNRYQASLEYGENTDSNALYEIVKQKILIDKYTNKEEYFKERENLYNQVVDNINKMDKTQLEAMLKIYGIKEEEKWTSDEELKQIYLNDILASILYSDAINNVIDDAMLNKENFLNQEYLSKLDELKKMNEENKIEGKTELISEIKDLYINQIILNSNIELKIFEEENNSIQNANKDDLDSGEEISKEEKDYSMHNGDVFAKYGNIIVYYNDFDSSIYALDIRNKNLKKLCNLEHGANKLYFDGENIYVLPYYYRGKGIYKIDLLGNINAIYSGASIQMWLTDDEIYFIDQIGFDDMNQTPQGNLCIIDKDGQNKQTLIENVKNYFKIQGDYIYYTDKDSRSIYKAKTDGSEKQELAKGRTYITSVTDKYLTYIDYEDGEKHRILYFDTNQNNAVGRFGNVNTSENGTYFFTRKITNKNNIEDDYTLYKVDTNQNTENEIWKSKEPLEYLSYIYKDYAYFRGNNGNYRVNLNSENKEKESVNTNQYFVNGKSYGFKTEEGNIKEILIYNLDNNTEENINI